jgi:hypothetical protein
MKKWRVGPIISKAKKKGVKYDGGKNGWPKKRCYQSYLYAVFFSKNIHCPRPVPIKLSPLWLTSFSCEHARWVIRYCPEHQPRLWRRSATHSEILNRGKGGQQTRNEETQSVSHHIGARIGSTPTCFTLAAGWGVVDYKRRRLLLHLKIRGEIYIFLSASKHLQYAVATIICLMLHWQHNDAPDPRGGYCCRREQPSSANNELVSRLIENFKRINQRKTSDAPAPNFLRDQMTTTEN